MAAKYEQNGVKKLMPLSATLPMALPIEVFFGLIFRMRFWRHFGAVLRPSSLFLLLSLCVNPIALAQTSQSAKEDLQAIEQQIKTRDQARAALEKKALKAEEEALKLSQSLVASARQLQRLEADTQRLEEQIERLSLSLKAKSENLDAQRQSLADLLGALARLTRRPAIISFLQPVKALDAARSTAVMGQIAPKIEERARLLRREITAMTDLETELSKERYRLKELSERRAEERRLLANLQKNRAQEAAENRAAALQEERALAALATQAKDLRSLIEQIIARNAKAPSLSNFVPPKGFETSAVQKAKGHLSPPVSGKIIRHFGDKEGSISAKGLRFETLSASPVLAPFTGQVVFAGPYRGYGQLLIIAHNKGYHSLLAGLGEVYTKAGDWVLTGEPIGLSEKANNAQNPSKTEEVGAQTPNLHAGIYLELRVEGSPVDPLPWLERTNQSASANTKPSP